VVAHKLWPIVIVIIAAPHARRNAHAVIDDRARGVRRSIAVIGVFVDVLVAGALRWASRASLASQIRRLPRHLPERRPSSPRKLDNGRSSRAARRQRG